MHFNSILPITSKDIKNNNFGSAFIIYRDNSDYYLITCAHVINDIIEDNEVRIGKQSAYLDQIDPNSGCDLSVVRVRNLPDLEPLKINPLANINDNVTISGYRYLKRANRYMIKKVKGQISEEIGLIKMGEIQKTKVWIVKIEDDKLEMGNSGSPVFNNEGEVIGVLSHRYESGNKGFVIAIESLKSVWQNMPESVMNIGQEDTSEDDVSHQDIEDDVSHLDKENLVESHRLNDVDYPKGPEGLFSEQGVRRYLENSKDFGSSDRIIEMLLILKNRNKCKQNTWLITTNNSLYCILDDLNTQADNTMIQWKMNLDQISTDSVKPNLRSNRINIATHSGWLYSKSLFKSQQELVMQIRAMIDRAKAEGLIKLEHPEKRILFQLLDEKRGRYLDAYRKAYYALSFELLQKLGYIYKKDRKYFLTLSGKQFMKDYLKQTLQKMNKLSNNDKIPEGRKEKRILRALYIEPDGNNLSYYSTSKHYSSIIEQLQNSKLIYKSDNKYQITNTGKNVTNDYLQELSKRKVAEL